MDFRWVEPRRLHRFRIYDIVVGPLKTDGEAEGLLLLDMIEQQVEFLIRADIKIRIPIK